MSPRLRFGHRPSARYAADMMDAKKRDPFAAFVRGFLDRHALDHRVIVPNTIMPHVLSAHDYMARPG